MGLEQLGEFLEYLGEFESGNNYNAVGPPTGKLGNALGRYQIMSANWPSWARQAGIPGADWRDPRAQDRVARYKMTEYYNRYGNWELVAVAWFAGPGNANKAAAHGVDTVGQVKDILGTSVTKYVNATAGRMSAPPMQEPGPAIQDRSINSRRLLAAVFGSMSNAIAGGQRTLPPKHRATPRPVEDTPASLQTGILESSEQMLKSAREQATATEPTEQTQPPEGIL